MNPFQLMYLACLFLLLPAKYDSKLTAEILLNNDVEILWGEV